MGDDGADVSDLIAAALDGDQGAWNDLVGRYTAFVYSVVMRHRIFGADADDVSQIVWLRLVEHLGDLRDPQALPKWLAVTTRNECLRLINANRRVRPFDPLTEDPDKTVDHRGPDEALLLAEQREVLLTAIAELPDRQRALLLLLVEEPKIPYAEISRRLGMPFGSIGPIRGRAMEKLRASPSVAALFAAELKTEDVGGGHRDIATVG
jgi:RNA polymerase sigma factor (sigma-70 family)